MNNPIYSGNPSFKILSEKNRKLDESSLKIAKKNWNLGGNKCQFPSKVFVINRSERPDRMGKFKEYNRLVYENFEVIRFEASVPNLKIKTTTDAIFDSFYRCILDSPDECICVMEDDAYIVGGSIEKIKKSWEELPEDWDILIGNHYFFGSIEILSENLAKPTSRASSANFIIVRKTIIPKINDNIHKREIQSINDFDHFVTSELVPINNFTIWPMVSREYPSFSDHKGKELDSSHKIRENSFKYLFIDQEEFYTSLESR
jgi:hypothetical protein